MEPEPLAAGTLSLIKILDQDGVPTQKEPAKIDLPPKKLVFPPGYFKVTNTTVESKPVDLKKVPLIPREDPQPSRKVVESIKPVVKTPPIIEIKKELPVTLKKGEIVYE